MPGTNDFIQHNPTEANQEPNGTFAADSLTTGGIGTDAVMPSPWMNARWYQDSTVCAALMQTLANKGYNVSVANLATLISVMTGALVTEADLRTPLVTVGYSPTPTFPASTANGFDIVLGGNVTSSAFDVAPNIGQILTFIVTQTSGGGATFVPPVSINGWEQIDSAPNSVTIQQFMVKEDDTIWPITSPLTTSSVAGSILISDGFSFQSRILTQTNPSRSFGTAYQNTTGRELELNVVGHSSASPGTDSAIQLVVGPSSSSMVQVDANGVANGPGYGGVNSKIPAGSWYKVNVLTGPMVLSSWTEMVYV